MRREGANAEGYWYRSPHADTPPLFVASPRAVYAPHSAAFYSRGMVAPGNGTGSRAVYGRLYPGEDVFYLQRPGAPPMIAPAGQMWGAKEGGIAILYRNAAIRYGGTVHIQAIDPRTGTVLPPERLPNGRLLTAPREVATVILIKSPPQPAIYIIFPGERIEIDDNADYQEVYFPFGEPVTIDAIAVADGILWLGE